MGSQINLTWLNFDTFNSGTSAITLNLNAATKILYITLKDGDFGLEGNIDTMDGSIIVDLSEYET